MWQYEPKKSFQSASGATEGGTGLNTAHIHIRKWLLLAAAVTLMLFLGSQALALTDASGIAFSMTVDPTSLKEPGEVTVTLNIENKSEQDIAVPMMVYDADNKVVASAFDGGRLDLLRAGEVKTASVKWRVSQKYLDEGKFAFNLRLPIEDAAGAITQVSLEAFANIEFKGEKVALEVERSILPEVIRSGGTVVVKYTLRNTGTVKLKEFNIKENNLIATAPQKLAALDPGATAEVTFTKKNVRSGVESSAVIDYKREGSKTGLRHTEELVKIPLAKPGFSAQLSADNTSVTIGGTVKLTLTLKNTGNISYTSVKISDAKLGEVFEEQQLPAGQELTLEKEITLVAPTAYKFSIALEDNTGSKQTESTNEVKISAYDEGQVMRLNVQITPDREQVDRLPGLVRFDILITNDSNYVAKPVNVYAGDLRIGSIPELQPGESGTVTRDFHVTQAGKFGFTVRTVDALNVTQSFKSNEVSIAFVPPTAAPTAVVKPTVPPVVTHSPVPVDTQGAASSASSAMLVALVALGVFLGATMLLVVASTVARARARRQSDLAYDHLDVAPKRDYADPSTYQGEGVKVPEQTPADEAGEPEAQAPAEPLPHEKYLSNDAEAEAPEVQEAAQEEGYQLTRGEDELPPAEPRSRRAAKHQKPTVEED